MFHYENQVLKFIGTSEGYVNVTSGRRTENGPSYVFSYIYNYTDHLGNIRVSYTNNGINAAIIEENHYYPFGLKHKKYGSVDKDFIEIGGQGGYYVGIDIVSPQARKSYQYKYNGKEFQDELGLNFYDYGARNYDPAIGRWMNVDPLADTTMELYSYVGNNPILFTDPTGMSRESTHIDDVGNVIAVVKDGDLGVYQHGRNADGGALTQYMIEKRQEKLGTSAGGTKVGETWTELGFADFDAYSEGKVKAQEGAFIDLDSNWATEKVSEVIRANPSNTEYISKAQGGGDWDMKRRSPNGNIAYGSLLFGKYASARDAGNFTAGAFTQMQVLVPNAFYDYGFGLYNQSGNNFKKSAVMGFIT